MQKPIQTCNVVNRELGRVSVPHYLPHFLAHFLIVDVLKETAHVGNFPVEVHIWEEVNPGPIVAPGMNFTFSVLGPHLRDDVVFRNGLRLLVVAFHLVVGVQTTCHSRVLSDGR